MRRLAFAIGLLTGIASGFADSAPASASGSVPASTPGSGPSSGAAGSSLPSLEQRLAAAAKHLATRGPEIEKNLWETEAALKKLEAEPADAQRATQKEKLAALRASLQKELSFLQARVTVYRSAVESRDNAARTREELKQFITQNDKNPVKYGRAELAAIQAQLSQAQATKSLIERINAGRSLRLKLVDEQLAKAGPAGEPALQAERNTLLTQLEASQESCGLMDAQIQLFQAKLATAPDTVRSLSVQPPLTTRAADEKVIDDKRKIAERLAVRAQRELNKATRDLDEIQKRLDAAVAQGGDTTDLRYRHEYYDRRKEYAKRCVLQAQMDQRLAGHMTEAALLQDRIIAARDALRQLESAPLPGLLERRKQAADFREQARNATENAVKLSQQAESEKPGTDIWAAVLHTINALSDAMEERRTHLLPTWDETLPIDRQDDPALETQLAYVENMQELLTTEREQVDSLMNAADATYFAILRQSALWKELADIYNRRAERLDPLGPRFWDQHRGTLNSMRILLMAVIAIYTLKLAIWLVQRTARSMAAGIARGKFSAKRVETLLKFFGSILKVLIGIFALIMVLKEYGIDPAKTTGALGLIGLILAGMFQQIVIDIVKGLDIITGRHYNIGDFVEFDGKSGHVIDFSTTHTRIRTPSGQEYNLPNSKCIPSRRFPDGYVDNYVDLAVGSAGQAHMVAKAVAPLCRHFSRRIEQLKEPPLLAEKFRGPRPGSIMLRYRLRVLPSCDWVVTKQFIPAVKSVLAAEGIELIEEPTNFFINRIQTFRQLFSRELSEEEILREASETERGPEPEPAGAAEPDHIAQPAPETVTARTSD